MIVLYPMRRLHDMYGSLVVVVVSGSDRWHGRVRLSPRRRARVNGYVSSTLFIFGNREKLKYLTMRLNYHKIIFARKNRSSVRCRN